MSEKVNVLVQEKEPWYSKINWTQILGFAAMLATAFGYTVPEDLITKAVVAIGALQSVLTLVLRTWFTTKVTPQSMRNT